MSSLPSLHHRLSVSDGRSSVAGVSSDSYPHSGNIVRRHGGPITVPRELRRSTPPARTDAAASGVKLLLNVNIQRGYGPVHILISVENTVGHLIKAAIEVYVKEMRRPLLTETDPRCFDLHYSQFSLESLKPEERLRNLESRNFFLCPKPNCRNKKSANSSCSDEAKGVEEAENIPFPFTRFMDFLL